MKFPLVFSRGSALLCAALLVSSAPLLAQQDHFVQKGSWIESMLASRESLRSSSTVGELELGPWYATAPLPAKSFGEVLFPELEVDVAATDEQGGELWTKRTRYADGVVHSLPLRDHASTYLTRVIISETARTLPASFGSDDGMEAWLNGEKILSHDTPRGPAPDQERADLALVAGENRLLLKIHNNAGGHGFYFSLRENPALRLWTLIERAFPIESARLLRDLPKGGHLSWFGEGEEATVSVELCSDLLKSLSIDEGELFDEFEALRAGSATANSPEWLEFYVLLGQLREARGGLDTLDLPALRRAVEDLWRSFPDEYRNGPEYLEALDEIEPAIAFLEDALNRGEREALRVASTAVEEITSFKRDVLLANPLLDFQRLLLIKRKATGPRLGLPQNWQGNCSLPRKGYDDEIVTLSPRDSEGTLTSFFKPEEPRFVGDVDLDFDAGRMLFSMLGSHDRWQIFEVDAEGENLRQVTPGEASDIDNYDACYLPDGRIIFDSTRVFQGIPCVGGSDAVANLHIMDAAGGDIRQLCFDQDHDWCPTVLNNGRILFTRWEYSDTPHYFTRLLMQMNPDGTGQMEYYGSNSFWPNTILYARPIPDHPSRVVGIVSGHHGVPRMGELLIFDPTLGRFEADGVVQRIPGYGQTVEPVIVDQLVNNSWPKFLHPYPLSEKYFLTACQPTSADSWGIYLVDIFDNLLCLAEEPGFALLEPIPFSAKVRPPVIPDKVNLDSDEATVFLTDVYLGPGLEGVPRGTIKALRVYEFHYGYNKMGGHKHVGIEGPWDIHRVLGTVPVESDGSAAFTVPANTPLAIQPLDATGGAVQLMRSWLTAMPGEVVSCVGCHEPQNSGVPVRPSLAAQQPPSTIEPWHGPTRGFSFPREVQPVLDRYCVGCHDASGGDDCPDLTRQEEPGWRGFTPSYIALHPFVRRPGPESDYHLLPPMEYHANTSELIQLLKKGHHGVELDAVAWDRLITWIDLNVPDHGTWGEQATIPSAYAMRRLEMRSLHAGRSEDPEVIVSMSTEAIEFVEPTPASASAVTIPECAGWPFDEEEASRRQKSAGLEEELLLDLGEGVTMKLVPIPAGEFVLGEADGFADEAPLARIAIESPFYFGAFEVTREQFSRFDPKHHNGYHDQNHKDHTTPGYPANGPQRPVIRISWSRAVAFCDWLSAETGLECTLPTEAEWEWACRAGTETPAFWGDLDTDFSPFANLADASTARLAVSGVNPQPIRNPSKYEDWFPKDERFDDSERLMTDVGSYRPNRWGLHDILGNVWEWTRSDYRSYPYRADDGRNAGSPRGEKVVRGGSWHDRPRYSRSASRLGYRFYQPVHNVGFRIVIHP
jgi:formylglycine-generating enzyme required for sulfatase activity